MDMKLLIDNEGDMELSIKYATTLALNKERRTLSCYFPSNEFMTVFVQNLVTSYIDNDVPLVPNLMIELVCPADEEEIDDELV